MIKVGELRAVAKDKQLNITHDFCGHELELKQYLPVFEKLEIIQTAYLSTLSEETKVVNKALFNVILSVSIVDAYTNVNMPKDIAEAYDLIVSTGLLSIVESELDTEMMRFGQLIVDYMETQEEERRADADIGALIGSYIKGIIEDAPTPEELHEISKALEVVGDTDVLQDVLDKVDKEE